VEAALCTNATDPAAPDEYGIGWCNSHSRRRVIRDAALLRLDAGAVMKLNAPRNAR
jgi:hypothetical protein